LHITWHEAHGFVVHCGVMMLVLGNDESHQHVDIEQARSQSALLAVSEAIDVFDSQRGSAGTPRKDSHATLEADVSLCDTT